MTFPGVQWSGSTTGLAVASGQNDNLLTFPATSVPFPSLFVTFRCLTQSDTPSPANNEHCVLTFADSTTLDTTATFGVVDADFYGITDSRVAQGGTISIRSSGSVSGVGSYAISALVVAGLTTTTPSIANVGGISASTAATVSVTTAGGGAGSPGNLVVFAGNSEVRNSPSFTAHPACQIDLPNSNWEIEQDVASSVDKEGSVNAWDQTCTFIVTYIQESSPTSATLHRLGAGNVENQSSLGAFILTNSLVPLGGSRSWGLIID